MLMSLAVMALSTNSHLRNFLMRACVGCKKRLFSTRANISTAPDELRTSAEPGERTFTVAVEGNIGCGKSSLLDYFRSQTTVQTNLEPVSKWTHVRGHNALKLLYDDPERWSFAFNNYAMLGRLEIHDMPHTAPVKMMERSLQSTYHVFVENSYRSGSMSGLEYNVLVKWFDHLLALPAVKLDLIVYLQTPPEVCYSRMRQRNRKEECNVPLSFIQELHDLYEGWLIEGKYPVPAPIMVIDANHDLDTMYAVYRDKTSEILCGCT